MLEAHEGDVSTLSSEPQEPLRVFRTNHIVNTICATVERQIQRLTVLQHCLKQAQMTLMECALTLV